MTQIVEFLASVHPFDILDEPARARVASLMLRRERAGGDTIYRQGEELEGLNLIESGSVAIIDGNDVQVSELGRGDSFGERGLLRDGRAITSARMSAPGVLLTLPATEFHRLMREAPVFARFFDHSPDSGARRASTGFATRRVADFLSGEVRSCTLDTPISEAARIMRDARVSSLGVTENGRLVGLVTVRDMSDRVVAQSRDGSLPVREIMTPDPVTLTPDALGSDVLGLMFERRIGHLPIVDGGVLRGMVTQTDLMRAEAISSSALRRDIARAGTVAELAEAAGRIPDLLAQLVASGQRHEIATRLVTDVADAVTRRLLAMAEDRLGPPPGAYLWAACGSQGRQEQTGVSDQDNCLILDDAVPADSPYFAELARIVSDGLDTCGYVYCPGDMMATNPQWRQPRSVWRRYFRGWIEQPDPRAQMLASVMFDLRAIGGDPALLEGLQAETLDMAARNSIFVAHMVSNSLKHRPPLGLFRGFATIRSGEHRDHIDMKLNGVVPITDLARVYALQGRIEPVNTRARLQAAAATGVVSAAGAADLVAAFDLIQTLRLENQLRQIRAGEKPGNFLSPADLSDFERNHLRDAFIVVRTMQSALRHGREVPI